MSRLQRMPDFIRAIYQAVFQRSIHKYEAEPVLDEPEAPQADEVSQSIERIELSEQLQMIRVGDLYMQHYMQEASQPEAGLLKGFFLQNDIFVSQGEDTVYRANMEYYFQTAGGERKRSYIISLVRFAGDEWRVFQIKPV